jgi:hypothetical protein
MIRWLRYLGAFFCGALTPLITGASMLVSGFIFRGMGEAPHGYVYKTTGTKYSMFAILFGLGAGIALGIYISSWIGKTLLGKPPKEQEDLEVKITAAGFAVSLLAIVAYIFIKAPR